MWTAKCTFKFRLQLTALRETSRSSLSVLASMKSRRRLGKLACCVIEKVVFFPGGLGGYTIVQMGAQALYVLVLVAVRRVTWP